MHLLQSSFIYLFASVVNRALPFLLLPILTRFLTTSEYGTLSIYQVLLSFVSPLIVMGMQIHISRNFAAREKSELAELIGNLFVVLSGAALIVAVILNIIVWCTGELFGIPPYWINILPVIAFCAAIYQFQLTLLRNQQRPYCYGIFELGNTGINLTISILLIVGFGFDWQGRGYGLLAAAVLMGAVSLILMVKNHLFTIKINMQTIKEIVHISLPLIPHAIGGVVIAMSDRLFIDKMVGKDAVGLYAVGYSFGMIVGIIVESFNKSWSPWFYRQFVDIDEAKKRRIVQYIYWYFGGIILIALLVAFVSQYLLEIMVAPKFHAAGQFIIWVATGYAFRGMYTMVFPFLVQQARTNFLPIVTGIAAIVNLLANYWLIKLNGPVGAAQATLLSFIISFLLTWWFACHIYPMPWKIWRAK